MSELQVINLFAGKRPDGQDVVEQVRVVKVESDHYRLIQSPAFVYGLASGDEIKYDQKDNSFELKKHSGNIAIRVFSRSDIGILRDNLRSELEKLGGELDFSNDRILIFSIHVSCGFKEIEAILNKHVKPEAETSVWKYGNVYDPTDGVTPLNWWMDLDTEDH